MSIFEEAAGPCECVHCRIRRAIRETPLGKNSEPVTNAEVLVALGELCAELLAHEPTHLAKHFTKKLLTIRKEKQRFMPPLKMPEKAA